MNKTNPNANAKAQRALRRKVQGALLATCLPIATLTACQTRKYNPNAKSLSEAYDAQSMDPASYFGLPGLVKGNNSNYVGFLIRTVPMLTHGSFEYAEKLARQIEEKTAKGWTVRPWGTERYTHVIYPTNQAAANSLDNSAWASMQAEIVKWGGAKVPLVQKDRLQKEPDGVVLLSAADLNDREKIEKLDNKGHQKAVISKKWTEYIGPKNSSQQAQQNDFKVREELPLTTEDPLWSLKFGHVFEAWAYIKGLRNQAAVEPGHGVRIGVIDTGYLPKHPEFAGTRAPNVNMNAGTNTVPTESDKDPSDKFEMVGAPPNPGHGSAVIAMLSAKMPVAAPERSEANVMRQDGPLAYSVGLVPGAEIIPVRSTSSIFFKNAKSIADAITYLVEQKNVNVISISLGGWSELSLTTALQKAQAAGVIVVSAAGNGTPFTMAPAVYPSVIAVGAGRIDCQVWGAERKETKSQAFTSPADEVDVLAPGENVWYPASYQNAQGKMEFSLRRGSGTSFATPYVAAMAALWIQANGGIEELKKTYRSDLSAIPKAFEITLKRYGLKFPQAHPNYSTEFKNPSSPYCIGVHKDWAGKTGAGFVDAYNLVAAPIPESVAAVNNSYKPNFSDWAKLFIEATELAQRDTFVTFELNPQRENSDLPVVKKVREFFQSSTEQNKEFVKYYLYNRYWGAAQHNDSSATNKTKISSTEERSEKVSIGLVQFLNACVSGLKSVQTAMSPKCNDIDEKSMQYIDRADGFFFLKLFQYLETKAGRKLTDDAKQETITRLLAGDPNWIPEDL